jgi:hypothetical protein
MTPCYLGIYLHEDTKSLGKDKHERLINLKFVFVQLPENE